MGTGSSTEISGVRVFKVIAGSPAAEAGLEVFFDFILEADGVRLDPNQQNVFAEKIGACENKPMRMVVYNVRVNATREVMIVPRKWAGTGLLGATVRFDTVDPADTHGIRVLEVFPNSPAAHAGLVPFQDFLLGTTQSAFRDIDELVEAVTSSINQRLQVGVYNTDSEMVREVVLVPNNDWGGEGYIGCDIGSGLLHRIPAPRRKPGGVPPAVSAVPIGPPSAGAPSAAPGAVPNPRIPPIPVAAGGGSGLPGIKVGGSWAPALAVPTGPAAGLEGAATAAGLPAPAYPPDAVAQGIPTPSLPLPVSAAAPPSAVAAAPAVAAPPDAASTSADYAAEAAALRGKVSGAQWPPPARTPASPTQEVGSPMAQGDFSPGAPMTPGGPELPRAPPCTPMGGLEGAPEAMDLSSVMAKAQQASYPETPVATPAAPAPAAPPVGAAALL